MVMREVKQTTKTHEERFVYVPKVARLLLDSCPTRFKNSFVLLNSKGNYHRNTDVFNASWRAAHEAWNTKSRKNQIPYRDPYTCRHTRAAELLSTGVEPGDAAKQMGHTLEMFYRIYSEWIEEFTKNRDLSRFEGYSEIDEAASK